MTTGAEAGPRLLEVDLSWPPEDYLRRKLEGLAAGGMDVGVAARTGRAGARTGLRGVRLVRLATGDESRARTLLAVVRDSARLATRRPLALARLLRAVWRDSPGLFASARVLRDHLPVLLDDPDVVHFEWETAAAGFLPLFEAGGRPVVVSSHGGIQVRPRAGDAKMTAVYPALFARAAAVHCVSEAVRTVAERFGLERGKARVIRPAVDTRFFAPRRGRSGDGLRIVAVGDVTWVKGYDIALKAIAALVEDGIDASYEVLGGEPVRGLMVSDRGRLSFLARELGLEGRIAFRGSVSQERVRECLGASDVLLQASLSEGLPHSVLEAMSCGLPVVVTDCGGLREAVEHGVEGLVCERRSPRALADALALLHADPALARRMGEAGRARVEADFALPDQIERFRGLYAELAGGG